MPPIPEVSLRSSHWKVIAAAMASAIGFTIVSLADVPAVKKPVHDRPETYEQLVRDPKYKNADLIVPAKPPLGPKAHVWEEHKRAMHLKALKRSDQDRRDLRHLLHRLDLARMIGQDQTEEGKTQRRRESSFQKLNDHLTIFRFTNFNEFIKEGAEEKAVALGKAFFWDPRFSSDQKVACATCHFAAGADRRTKATVTMPVNFGVHLPWPDPDQPPSGRGGFRPYNLTAHSLVNETTERPGPRLRGLFDPRSLGGFATREVIGSVGVSHRRFKCLKGDAEESEEFPPPAPMAANTVAGSGMARLDTVVRRIAELEGRYRQVTQRNAGTVINAVLNSRNFHDSRADSVFNGRTGWGLHTEADVNEAVFVLRNVNGTLTPVSTATSHLTDDQNSPAPPAEDQANTARMNPYFIANASLASQAVEPIVSDVEMSYHGRMFHHIARRMLDKKLLERQEIHAEDSSLRRYAAPDQRVTYEQLIKEVFVDEWWNHAGKVQLPAGPLPDNEDLARGNAEERGEYREYSQMEANFSLFWGLALHVYQSTLISDDSPFDRDQRAIASVERARETPEGSPVSLLNESARRGWDVFQEYGCIECHAGTEFTSASFEEAGLIGPDGKLQFPELLDEAGDIEIEAELCPEAPPIGVECMNVGGRFDSVYDIGNYVIGISRFERRPSLPDLESLRPEGLRASIEFDLFRPDVAHWEDSGIGGLTFVPPEEESRPFAIRFETTSELQRARFAQHLLRNDIQMQQVGVLLGIEGQDPDQFNVLEKARTTKAEAMPEALIEAETLDLLRESIGPGNPLNSTQRPLRGSRGARPAAAPEIPLQPASPNRPSARNGADAPDDERAQRDSAAQRAGRKTRASSRSEKDPVLTPPSESPETPEKRVESARKWGLVTIVLNGQKRNWVTQQTSRPLHSIAREFEPTWEAELDRRGVRHPDLKEKVSDAGAFKTPSLRNIELTGPYMHNGSLLTIESVIDFYNRGGDFNRRLLADADDRRTGHIHSEMEPLNLTEEQKVDLIEFLKSLTDDRVRRAAGAFDHPSLTLFDGVDHSSGSADVDGDGAIQYREVQLPATGVTGGSVQVSFERHLLAE